VADDLWEVREDVVLAEAVLETAKSESSQNLIQRSSVSDV
jgi:hypothetical protein